jgi:membrane associated rhomboid family serine protease
MDMEGVIKEIKKIPLGVRLLFSIISFWFLLGFKISRNSICLIPTLYMSPQIHRLYGSVFFHINWIDFFISLLFLIHLGPKLETKLGTAVFLLQNYHMIWVSGTIYTLIAHLLDLIGFPSELSSCNFGFSRILFAYITIVYCKKTYLNIYGLLIPGFVVPVLLFVIQLILVGNWIGSLSGILTGGLLFVSPTYFFTWIGKSVAVESFFHRFDSSVRYSGSSYDQLQPLDEIF